MNLVLFDDYLLSRIFEKLRTKELIASVALVCKKWSKVVFTGNHRTFPPGLYSIFQEGLIDGDFRTYPLLGFRALCECNLLKEMEPNKQLTSFMTANPFEGQRWVVTRNRGTVLEPMSVPVQSKADEGNTIGEFSAYSTGIYEMTQLIDLEQRYIELGLTQELSTKVKDLCPELRLRFTALQFLKDSNSEVLIKMTVSMDDGTPVLAPYNNNTYTSYTRDAMFVKSVESNDSQKYTIRELDMWISGYPREAKRLIVSIRGHFENANLTYCKPTLQVSKARVQTSSHH